MRRMLRLVPLLAVMGCKLHHNLWPGPARLTEGPDGAQVRVSLRDATAGGVIAGQLLETGAAGVRILRDGARVTFVPWQRMRILTLPDFPQDRYTVTSPPPDSALAERLRLVSRFAFGLSPEARRRLLALQRQAAEDSLP